MVFRIERTRKAADGSTPPGRAGEPAHQLLSLQHTAGNAAVARLLGAAVQRAPSEGSASGQKAVVKGTGAAPARRIVYLDNDVVGEVADGNKAIAESLQKLRASGADIRISRYNYAEATRGAPVGAGARRLIVKELGITIDEGGGLASRADTYKELSTGKPASVQPKDVPVIAAVRAAGPNAELWSLDGGVKQNAARFGVRLAPESSISAARTTRADVRTGLNNVGLQSWEIAADGTPVRRGQLIGTGQAPQQAPGVGANTPTTGAGRTPIRTGGGGGTSGGGTTTTGAGRTPIRTGGGGGTSGGGGFGAMGGGRLLTAGLPQVKSPTAMQGGVVPGLGRPIVFQMSVGAVNGLVGYLGSWLLAKQFAKIEDTMFKYDCKQLEPAIGVAINQQQAKISDLLKLRKTIYANVRMAIVQFYGSLGWQYSSTRLLDVDISTADIRREEDSYFISGGQLIPFIYSFELNAT